jgi:ferrous iron transport protein B
MTLCSLNELKKNEEAVIVDISGTADVRQRFYELGIFPGLSVSCFNHIAFGGPLTIQVDHSKLSLRQEDAAHIVVDRA